METLFRPAVTDHDPFEGMTKKEIRAAEASSLRLIKSLDRLEAYIHRCPTTVKRYIDKHPLQRKSNDFFAELTKIDSEILHRVFKRQNHITIPQYQLQKRMEVAATLLQEGRLTQKQIANKCGYQHANSFSRAFKKINKLTPTQYLKKK
jgi:AraC-like DNA-binding protein